MTRARPTLLEPVMNVEVYAPSDFAGDLMGDLNGRRGRIAGMDTRGATTVIQAQVPMAEMLTYEQHLTSATGGRGSLPHGVLALRRGAGAPAGEDHRAAKAERAGERRAGRPGRGPGGTSRLEPSPHGLLRNSEAGVCNVCGRFVRSVPASWLAGRRTCGVCASPAFRGGRLFRGLAAFCRRPAPSCRPRSCRGPRAACSRRRRPSPSAAASSSRSRPRPCRGLNSLPTSSTCAISALSPRR